MVQREEARKLQKHLRLSEGDINPYVLVPGDLGRVERIVEQLDDARLISRHREYVVYNGEIRGIPLTVCSTGIGGPAASIAFEELIRIGAQVLLRVGSAGGRQDYIPIGTPVVVTAAHRGEGTTRAYMPPEFPAVADLEVTNALVEALREQDEPYYCGIGYTRDAYYAQDQQLNLRLKEAGVVAAEQEAATLFIVGTVRGVKTGTIVSTDSNIWLDPQPSLEEKERLFAVGEKRTITAALRAVEMMVSDRQ